MKKLVVLCTIVLTSRLSAMVVSINFLKLKKKQIC